MKKKTEQRKPISAGQLKSYNMQELQNIWLPKPQQLLLQVLQNLQCATEREDDATQG